MALADYIGTGTYSMVDHIGFNEKIKHVKFQLNVFADNTKEDKIAEKFFDFVMDTPKESVINIEQTTPPITPNTGDRYIVASTGATGEWADYPGQLMTWDFDGSGEWMSMKLQKDLVLFNETSNSYIKVIDDSGTYTPYIENECSRIWDSYFTKTLVFNTPGNNLHTQIYKLLKTQKGFEFTSDVF